MQTERDEKSLPPFQIAATGWSLFSAGEMDSLIAACGDDVGESRLGTGLGDPRIRRSRVTFLDPTAGGHRWVYDRIWSAAVELNEKYFCVGIDGIAGRVQLARYDGDEQGFYDWHTDFGDMAPNRKISITVQLSDPADYEGGDLEFLFRSEPARAERARGSVTAFPSFLLHRVSPVTRGTRWSLVAWITGPRWY